MNTQAIRSPKSPSNEEAQDSPRPGLSRIPQRGKRPQRPLEQAQENQSADHGDPEQPPRRIHRVATGSDNAPFQRLDDRIAHSAYGPGEAAKRVQLLGLHRPMGECNDRGAETDEGYEDPGDGG